ncbi:MAG: hypothetical protein R3D68_09950 [Hyphomicrobiaceae bacterium]
MGISYISEKSHLSEGQRHLLNVLGIVNTSFAVVVLLAWSSVQLFLMEPIEWATWQPITRTQDLASLGEYPFVILWLLPLLGMFGGMVFGASGKSKQAYFCATTPIILISGILAWYYFLPQEWH